MSIGRRSTDELNRDRMNIAELYCKGLTQYEIGKRLGKSQQTISHDLKAIRKAWLASSVRDFDALRSEQLARIDRLERTHWDAWERSLEPTETTTRYAEADSANKGKPKLTRMAIIENPGLGDIRYLDRVLLVVQERSKLLGLDAPIKISPTDPSGKKPYQDVTDEDRFGRLSKLIEALKEREPGPTDPD